MAASDARAGAPTPIEARYARHFDRLASLATGWLGDRDAAEDVAQAALVAAWEAERRGAPIAHPDAWLTRAARNLAVSHLRRQAGRRRRLFEAARPAGSAASAPPSMAADPAAEVERRERLDAVLAAILALPARHRDDLLLHLRATSPAEAAAARGLTTGAWRARLVRAREALRLALAPPEAAGPPPTVAERRRAVAALRAAGRPPAAIARALGLPRRAVIADLVALRRVGAASTGEFRAWDARSPAVALLRQLLLFGDAPPAARAGRTIARPSRRRRRARPSPAQLALPPCPEPPCSQSRR